MKKEPSPYFDEKFSFLPFQDKRWLTSAAACAAGVAVLIVYFQSTPKSEAYAVAEEAMSKWEVSSDDSSYAEMKKAFKKVPSFEKKYEAAIAQKLFQKDRISDALVFAHNSLKRIEGDAPFHASFDRAGFLSRGSGEIGWFERADDAGAELEPSGRGASFRGSSSFCS